MDEIGALFGIGGHPQRRTQPRQRRHQRLCAGKRGRARRDRPAQMSSDRELCANRSVGSTPARRSFSAAAIRKGGGVGADAAAIRLSARPETHAPSPRSSGRFSRESISRCSASGSATVSGAVPCPFARPSRRTRNDGIGETLIGNDGARQLERREIAVDRVAEGAELHPEPFRALQSARGEIAARVEVSARADERLGLELKDLRIVRRLNARREIGRVVDEPAIEQFGQSERVEGPVRATRRKRRRRQQNLAQKQARGGRRRGRQARLAACR